MTERGVPVDHTTIYRWGQKYAPELDKQTRRYRQVPDWQASSWRVDETYIRVGGTWCYLYRAITAGGQTLDFYLSPKRNVAAAKRFLANAVRSNASAGYPRVINTGTGRYPTGRPVPGGWMRPISGSAARGAISTGLLPPVGRP